jgi:hypothetical protein
MPIAQTIDGVIDELTTIIERAKTEQSRIGYFPALYRRVTRAVKAGIAAGRFADGPRMERFDVVFANRYLEAYDHWRAGRPVRRCWQLAFQTAARTDRIILQHLLAGMNAHINVDLAIAAAETAPGAAIQSLQGDFMEINRLLAEQVDSVQTSIASVAPMMWLLDTAGGRSEGKIVEFSMSRARDAAWAQAVLLAGMDHSASESALLLADTAVTAVGRGVISPPGMFLQATLQFLVWREASDVRRIIVALE